MDALSRAGEIHRGGALDGNERRDEVPDARRVLESLLAGGVPADLHGEPGGAVVTNHDRLVVGGARNVSSRARITRTRGVSGRASGGAAG